jgi:hypothetical protein
MHLIPFGMKVVDQLEKLFVLLVNRPVADDVLVIPGENGHGSVSLRATQTGPKGVLPA